MRTDNAQKADNAFAILQINNVLVFSVGQLGLQGKALHNLNNCLRKILVACHHLQMVITGRTADTAAAQKSSAQKGALALVM